MAWREQDGGGEVALQLPDGPAPVAGRVEAHKESLWADGGAGWAEVSPQPDVGDRSLAGGDRGVGVARADDQAAHHPQPPGCAGGGGHDRVADPLTQRAHGDAAEGDLVRLGGGATLDHGRQELALSGRQRHDLHRSAVEEWVLGAGDDPGVGGYARVGRQFSGTLVSRLRVGEVAD